MEKLSNRLFIYSCIFLSLYITVYILEWLYLIHNNRWLIVILWSLLIFTFMYADNLKHKEMVWFHLKDLKDLKYKRVYLNIPEHIPEEQIYRYKLKLDYKNGSIFKKFLLILEKKLW